MVDLRRLVPTAEMQGEDSDETAALHRMLEAARRYVEAFSWCEGIDASYFGLGVGDVVAVFLFGIRPARPDVDEWLWVIHGDLPPAYLVTDNSPNAACALQGYIELMDEWVKAAATGGSVEDLIPVNVPPTPEWAATLARRLRFLEEHVLVRYPIDLEQCN
jgi:hypothetical protein